MFSKAFLLGSWGLFGKGLRLKFTQCPMYNVWTTLMVTFNPFPNKPWFLRVCSKSLLKTLWEKEKLLVTSNFSFSHRVFCGKRRNCLLRAISPFPTVFSAPLEYFLPFSSNSKLSSANPCTLEESKIWRLGKG